MDSIYMKIPEEKRHHLINAAQKHFSVHGYEKTSLNKIILDAGISKGLLYHYFKSKAEMYLHTLMYTTNLFLIDYYGRINLEEKDFIKRLYELICTKMEMVTEYPFYFNMLTSLHFEKSDDVIDVCKTYSDQIKQLSTKMLYENIDQSHFKEDLDMHLAMESMIATLQNFNTNFNHQNGIESVKDFDDQSYKVQLDKYFDFFRKSYYRN